MSPLSLTARDESLPSAPVPYSVASATSLPGRGESIQGDGFSGGGKVCGSAKRPPLGELAKPSGFD